MEDEIKEGIISYGPDIPVRVINLTNAVLQSAQRKFLLGVKGLIKFGKSILAPAELLDLEEGVMHMSVNVISLTNTTHRPLLAQVSFDAASLETGIRASQVSWKNRSLFSFPMPKVEIRFSSTIPDDPNQAIVGGNQCDRSFSTAGKRDKGGLRIPTGGIFQMIFTAWLN